MRRSLLFLVLIFPLFAWAAESSSEVFVSRSGKLRILCSQIGASSGLVVELRGRSLSWRRYKAKRLRSARAKGRIKLRALKRKLKRQRIALLSQCQLRAEDVPSPSPSPVSSKAPEKSPVPSASSAPTSIPSPSPSPIPSSFPVVSDCVDADESWKSLALSAETGSRFRLQARVQTDASLLDGVLGLSQGPAVSYGELAAIFRVGPEDGGTLDARDAGSYRKDEEIRYEAGSDYLVTLEVDLALARYSVIVQQNGLASERILAAEYRFRTGAPHETLQYLVIKSESGGMRFCDVTLEKAEALCGDGFVEGDEQCDDGAILSGDGCSASCQIEGGYTCGVDSPSICVPQTECNDGVDNDRDGAIDSGDFSCRQGADSEGEYLAQCQDGADNDLDGDVDEADRDCSNLQDNSEEDAPTLIPGDGFSGRGEFSTQDPPGSSAQVIARWNVVPFQAVSERTQIGVIADHIGDASNDYLGVERVDFSLDNGPALSVYEPTINERTGVLEYVVTIDPSEYGEVELVELQAVVYPHRGKRRELIGSLVGLNTYRGEHSMFLNVVPPGRSAAVVRYVDGAAETGGNGSQLSPFRDIESALASIDAERGSVDFGELRLLPGEYQIPNTSDYDNLQGWLTIRSADGDRDSVILKPSSQKGVDVNKLRFHQVRIENGSLAAVNAKASGSDIQQVWFDDVVLRGDGGTDGVVKVSGITSSSLQKGSYATNVRAEQFKNLFIRFHLLRGIQASNIFSDSFSKSLLILGVEADNLRVLPGSGAHPDIWQWGPNDSNEEKVQNIIMDGFVTEQNNKTQGIFFQPAIEDVLIRNIQIDNNSTSEGSSMRRFNAGNVKHFIVRDASFPGEGGSVAWWSESSLENVLIDNFLANTRFGPICAPNYSNGDDSQWQSVPGVTRINSLGC